MDNRQIHVSYCELPLEARALFTIFGLAASARFMATPPRQPTLNAMLNIVWDAERLTLDDFSDPDRITKLIETYIVTAHKTADRSAVARRKTAA